MILTPWPLNNRFTVLSVEKYIKKVTNQLTRYLFSYIKSIKNIAVLMSLEC